jgi:nitrate reductase gamma subunit
MRGATSGLLVGVILLTMFMSGFVNGATADARMLDPNNESFHINQSDLEDRPPQGPLGNSTGPLPDVQNETVVDYESPDVVQQAILAFVNRVMHAGVLAANFGIAVGSAIPNWVPDWILVGWAQTTTFASVLGVVGFHLYRLRGFFDR